MKTQNEAYGFYGAMGWAGQDPDAAWGIALHLIVSTTRCPDWAVRAFLNSGLGRHFADDVMIQMSRGMTLGAAIRAAVDVYMSWRIDRATSRRHGIPVGLPYLTGWVCYHEILEEVAADGL